MKLLILALGLLSLPAFAETPNDIANQEADANVCIGNHNFGVCLGDRGPRRGGPGWDHGGDRGGDRGPGWNHGGDHGGPGWNHGGDHGGNWGPGPRGVVCDSQNLRGNRFRGFGRWVQEAQHDALNNCYRAGSRSCRVIGCR